MPKLTSAQLKAKAARIRTAHRKAADAAARAADSIAQARREHEQVEREARELEESLVIHEEAGDCGPDVGRLDQMESSAPKSWLSRVAAWLSGKA